MATKTKKPVKTYPGYVIEISPRQEFERDLGNGVAYRALDRQFVLRDPEGRAVLTKFGTEHGSVHKTLRWFQRKYPEARFDFSRFDPVTIVRVSTKSKLPMMQSGYCVVEVQGDETDADLAYEVHLACESTGYLVADYDGNGKSALIVPC